MRPFAYIIGIVFLLIGIAGFVPNLIVEERLADVFHVNIWLNTLHVVSGALAFCVVFANRNILRAYYQFFGVIYAILALMGFVYGERACLILGFGAKD